MSAVISSYSNQKVFVSNIEITPKLDVIIGKIEYITSVSNTGVNKVFVIRSAEVFWSLLNNSPFITAKFGSIFYDNEPITDRLNFRTPTFRDINFNKVSFIAEADQFSIVPYGVAQDLNFSGTFNKNMNLITGLSFDAATLKPNNIVGWSANDINVKVDQLNLNEPLSRQLATAELSVSQIRNEDYAFKISEVGGVIDWSDKGIDFQLNKAALKFERLEGAVGSVQAIGSNVKIPLQVDQTSFLNYLSADSNFSVQASDTDILITQPELYTVKLTGALNGFDLNISENFIGSLPASDFELNLITDDTVSRLGAATKIYFKTSPTGQTNVWGDLSGYFVSAASFLECVLATCHLNMIAADYKLHFDQEWISGGLTCSVGPCTIASISHNLRTSDTAEVFTTINDSKIISPFVTLYLHSLIRSGTEFNNGHELKLN